uniref:COMM domain-containing protein n=1 Tax=Oncorhynchus tshawytscha TaxID=74940 RepID=A0A8C8MFY3_ONCTS
IVQLQFTKDTLPDSVSNDFLNINKFNEQQFTSLTEIVFNFLLEPKETTRLLQQLSEFAEENGMSAGPLRNRMKSFMLLPYGALKKNLTADQAAHFSQQWSSHYPVLSRLAVGQTLMVNQLVDMEWKFGGKTNNLRIEVPLRMLTLVIRKGNSTENVYMELTLPRFYNYLHEMERAKASMDCFS